jgi:predicted nuclease with TOPRIM domain
VAVTRSCSRPLSKVSELNNGSKTMGLNKLIKRLQETISNDTDTIQTSSERLEELLGEIEAKEKKLKHKLSKETNAKKRKDLKLQLKIASTQLKKGRARLHELEIE